MWVLRESWCFCNGGAKSDKLKSSIFSSKSPAMARVGSGGTGFLIQRNLLLTTHANLPSLAAAQTADIRLCSAVAASLVPHRFFISSSVLDLTIVGVDVMDENTQPQPPHYIKTSSKPNLDIGSVVYLLGYAEKNELISGEGKVVIATDNLIKISTDGCQWSPGSAGFDTHGNLAFMLCDPMKLATSPNTKSSSTSSSSSSRKDHPTQFGIPIPVICDWLNQHWEGNLDDLNKPKLPLMRLVSGGQKTPYSSSSFTMRQVFKPTETEDEDTMTSRHPAPARENENPQLRLLDINIPPRPAMSSNSLQAAIRILQNSAANSVEESALRLSPGEGRSRNGKCIYTVEDAYSTNGAQSELDSSSSHIIMPEVHDCPFSVKDAYSTNGAQSEVFSSSSPIVMPEINDYYSSDGETTMYSAETAESRNYPSPKAGRSQYVGRSQSCVNYNRWQQPIQKIPATRTSLEKARNSMSGKVYSQGVTTQRSNDYFSPTVSSILKKRNSTEQLKPRVSTERPTRIRPAALPSSPRWIF